MYTKKFSKHIIYSIIGEGMRLYETSDRGASCLMLIFFPLYPRRAIRVVLSVANLIFVLTCLTPSQYLSFLFLAMRSANLLTNCLHSFDIPPDVRNTAGVKVAFSTFNTLSRYSLGNYYYIIERAILQ